MQTVVRVLYVLGQVLGVAALLSGVLLLWGLGWSLLVGGLLLVVGCTAFEAFALARPAVPSGRRSGSTGSGVE